MTHNKEQQVITQPYKGNGGDKDAFGVLYDQYIEKIYRYIYYKTFNKEVAWDITSDVFLKAFEKFSQFNPAKGNFSSWIYGIAKNSIADHYRSRSSHPTQSYSDAFDVSDDYATQHNIHMTVDLNSIKEHIQKLDGVTRDVLLLRLWEELSYKEISEIIGKSEDNCKMIFSRSIKKLRAQMPLAAFLLLLTLHI